MCGAPWLSALLFRARIMRVSLRASVFTFVAVIVVSFVLVRWCCLAPRYHSWVAVSRPGRNLYVLVCGCYDVVLLAMTKC